MFNIEDIIGDIVYIDFQDISIYNNIGIENKFSHFLIKCYDHIGVWLAHPDLQLDKKLI